MRYLFQLRNQIFVKGYEFLSFAKNMDKYIDNNISKNLSGKYSQDFFITLNNLQQMHLKFPQKE